MPTIETPPNSAPPVSPPSSPLGPDVQPLKVRAGRYGDLEHHELLHLLDTIDDERSRSRFRESIYISVFVYLALAWFVFYGPRILFHQGRIVSPADVLKQRDKELTYLNLPKDLSKLPPPKSPKALSDKSSVAQTSHPTLDKKTLEQLQAMRRAGEEARRSPLPPTPQPQPQAPPQPTQQAQAQPPPPAPQPQVRQVQPPQTTIPDAPKPNFSVQRDPGQAIRDAARTAAAQRGQGVGSGGEDGAGARVGHQGANTGLEVLSDTLGVDFGPYIKQLLRMVKAAWIPLIPEETRPPLNKEGTTLIRFRIEPDGRVSFMNLDDSTHDQAIDRAAWGGITGVGQFPPLPPAFKGPNLVLRIQFIISHHYTGDQ